MGKYYINPKVKSYSSFDEALSDSNMFGFLGFDKSEKDNLEDYFDFPRTFVVAEPGYGKTRLLRHISYLSRKDGRNSVYIDLKKIPKSTTILDRLDLEIKALTVKDRFEISNRETITLCFDGLDEVKSENFSEIVENIKLFTKNYPNIFVIVACRWHFFEKYKELFSETDFKYVRMYPFSVDQVKTYLEKEGIAASAIEKIFDSLHFKNRNLIIQTPRYLELLASYIKKEGVEDVGKLTRTALFDYFIYKKLEIEDKKLNTQKKDLIKRVLEKMALVMEIYQTNLLSKDELMTFFDDLRSDLKISLLQQVPLEVFYDKSLLKDNVDSIEFDNTEFQEYLAAKEITRLGHSSQVVFDLAVDPVIREIYPSWFNTLTFLIELDVSLLKPILDFGSNHTQRYIQDEEYHRFLTRVNLNLLSGEERKMIFDKIFTYYQEVLHWIEWDICKSLSFYFDISQKSLLEKYINKKKYQSETERCVQLGNLAQIVGFVLERDLFNNKEKKFWRNKLMTFAKDQNKSGVLQRHALFALKKLNDESVIKDAEVVWKHTDNLVKDEFLELCSEVSPNNEVSIKYFVAGVKLQSFPARHSLYLIHKTEGLTRLLQYFIDDEHFLNQFLDHESVYDEKDSQIIKNLSDVWDENIKAQLETFIQKAFESEHWYNAEKSEFITSIASLLQNKDKSYLFRLIEQISKSDVLKKNIFSFEKIFASLLEKKSVKEFIKRISKIEHGARVGLWTLQKVKFSKKMNADVIYEEGRQYLPKEYSESEQYWEKENKKIPEELNRYQQFQYKLQPSVGMFMNDVFSFYLDNIGSINKNMTTTERKRLIDLVIGSVLEKLDPAEQKLTITSKSEGEKTYTTHAWISTFGDCLIISEKLHIGVSKFRQKVISYIPFAYDSHLKAIFQLIQNITPDETKKLLKVYTEKSSDLWQHMPDSFIKAVKKYSIYEAAPILREFIDLESFSIYDRKAALDASEYLDPNEKLLNNIFKKYLKKQPELSQKANKLLIEKHNNKKAIDWVFKQIISNAFKFTRPMGTHSVGARESELDEKEFASPLMNLKDGAYQNNFLNLLGYSFKLIVKDTTYYAYAQYIWEIVYSYFDNLKEGKTYDPLRSLESYITKHYTDSGANWFSAKIKELRRSYMNFIGKPKNIAECISTYNNFKSNQYLEISNPRELLEKIKDIINKELKTWITGEGKKIMQTPETDIQKNIRIQLENSFLRRGFRTNEIIVIREPQLLDDKRTDFLIFYGFVGPLIIEVKLSTSSDLKGILTNKKSYKSIVHYMDGYRAHFGIFLVIDNNDKKTTKDKNVFLKKIRDTYQKIEHVEVVSINGLI